MIKDQKKEMIRECGKTGLAREEDPCYEVVRNICHYL